MGLLNKLNAGDSSLSEFNGATPPTPIGATDQSKLHDQYSLNGTPSSFTGAPSPSVLDLNGVTPPKYTDNPPQ
tara:strand:- start:1325 stop:1543 length:219 start_codon:yes stop_codon:yes gene_type:complete